MMPFFWHGKANVLPSHHRTLSTQHYPCSMSKSPRNMSWMHAVLFLPERGQVFTSSCVQIPTATRDGVYTAGYLGLSPALKESLDSMESLQTAPAAARFVLAGVASGAFAALVTQPVDTIKTRMQVQFKSLQLLAPLIRTERQLHDMHLWGGL